MNRAVCGMVSQPSGLGELSTVRKSERRTSVGLGYNSFRAIFLKLARIDCRLEIGFGFGVLRWFDPVGCSTCGTCLSPKEIRLDKESSRDLLLERRLFGWSLNIRLNRLAANILSPVLASMTEC